MINKIIKYRWILRSMFSTIYFNFHYLPCSQAIKLPIILYKPKLLAVCSSDLHHGRQDGRMALAVDDEVDDVDVRRIDELAELRHRGDKRHGDGTAVLALLLTIDVAGHQTLLAVLLRSFLSKGFTLLTCNVNLFHCVTLN